MWQIKHSKVSGCRDCIREAGQILSYISEVCLEAHWVSMTYLTFREPSKESPKRESLTSFQIPSLWVSTLSTEVKFLWDAVSRANVSQQEADW